MDKPEVAEDSDNDSSDEDYVPKVKPDEILSEVDSDGDSEESLSEAEDSNHKHKRRLKQASKSRKKRKQVDEDSPNSKDENSRLTEEEKKKKEEDVWADFMRDTGFKSKNERSEIVATSTVKTGKVEGANQSKLQEKPQPDKVKITQVFNFAGEEVTVEKEVSRDSASARFLSSSDEGSTKKSVGANKAGLSGIGGLLNQLGKKPKITTLEKSKLDWDKFKREQNLEEELQNHNKGKDGYLERQDFLQRADLRRFEIEKEIRTVERNKRVNN